MAVLLIRILPFRAARVVVVRSVQAWLRPCARSVLTKSSGIQRPLLDFGMQVRSCHTGVLRSFAGHCLVKERFL